MISNFWRGLCGAVILCGLPSFAAAQNSTFSVVLNAGYLSQSSTVAMNSTATPNGALLLLIAAGGTSSAGPGTAFTTTPSAGSYVGGGDVILGASSFNAIAGSNGVGKITNNSFTSLTLPTTVSSSAYIELRWYPNITLAQYNNGMGVTPTAGSVFGAYNPLVTNSSGNTTLNPDQPTGQTSSPWELPSGGSTINLYFLTTNSGVSGAKQDVTEGYANFTVPVPEPSSGTLGGLGLVVIVGAARFWRRRSQTSQTLAS